MFLDNTQFAQCRSCCHPMLGIFSITAREYCIGCGGVALAVWGDRSKWEADRNAKEQVFPEAEGLMISNPVATRKDSKDHVKNTGDYAIFDLCGDVVDSGIMFCCPHDGCGDICHLPINRPGKSGWTWTESTKTLSPSIQRLDKDHCAHHFSLIDGKWVP